MKKLILLIPFLLFAFVNVTVNKKRVYPGEEVVFTIEASGNDIKFPQIKDIDGFPVQGTAVTQNITVLNGNMQKSVSKSYIFFPDKSVTIPSFTVEIDSKKYKTPPVKITVEKPKQSNNPDFKISLIPSKNKVYIGEPFVFKLVFYQKQGLSPQSIEIQKPDFTDFIAKQISKKEYSKDGFDVTEYSFLLIAQKAGKHKIGPILAKIGYLTKENPFNDPFFALVTSSLKYTNIFSNTVEIDVKPIPQNTVYGKFSAKIYADKTDVKAGEPVKITLEITGCGDFYDLPDFKIAPKNATVYENAPVIKTEFKNGSLCGIYKKEFTVVPAGNIIIKPVTFKAYEGNVTDIKTNSLYITVKTSQKTSSPPLLAPKTEHKNEKITIKHKKEQKNIPLWILAAVFFTGAAAGAAGAVIISKRKKTSYEHPLEKQIKKAGDRELFNILLEFSSDPYIDEILKKLEENIYKGANHKINKKQLISHLKGSGHES